MATRQPAHEPGYPNLGEILDAVAETCASEEIAASQLETIVFLEEAIVLTVADGPGEKVVYMFGIVGL